MPWPVTPSRTDFNAAGTAVFGRVHLHVAPRTDKRRIVTLGALGAMGASPCRSEARAAVANLQVGVVGELCSSAAVPACRLKKARRWCRQRLQGVHSAARYVPSPSRQDPAGPHGPLKAEAGVSCRRLLALPPYFVLVSTAGQFRSDILPNATRYQFMSKTAPISHLES